ncbi:MAG: UDP-glucose/GDP-mannose dehydrogenase family protein [candidate division Zixibacteria bacterium]|nr:UDP-glucose/GDP-mannose dehydrogenase family protein [candidate division Zixibacteria bacterium]
MNICVVGTGYVGLVVGTCFADFGNYVVCVDKDTAKIEALRRGELPIYEVGLTDFVRRNKQAGRLVFSTDLPEAVRRSLVVFIAVGTASTGNGSPDLSSVFGVAGEIGRVLTEYKVIVNKSTVPVGTGARVAETIRENLAEPVDFTVVSNPEFLREGTAIDDFLHPDRVVIGTDNSRAQAILKDVYRPLALSNTPILQTTRETAELIKYAANAFLAMKISYINEMAHLCELVGADVGHVAMGIGADARIGPSFLQPGPGYGGSCLPKDTRALLATAQEAGCGLKIIDAVVQVNQEQLERIIDKIRRGVGGSLKGKTIGVLGLAFKANTDDMREAPAVGVIRRLLEESTSIRAYDPVAEHQARKILPDIRYESSPYEAATGCDALVVLTEWNEFRDLDFDGIRGRMRAPVLIDARNMYNPSTLVRAGFVYEGVGRKKA